MAIDAYVGLPGHGKSYGVVEHVIIPSLKQGRHVVTNIPLEIDSLLVDFGGTVEQLPADWFERPDLGDLVPSGSVLVLDELWRRWPNGMKANAALLEDKALLAEHRHRVDSKGRSMRVVLVTQDLAQLASWARALVETTYRMVKKSKKLYRVDIYRGAVAGPRPPKSALLRQTAGRFKPDVYRYYQSATQSNSGGVGDESTADGRGSILRSWGLWGLVAIVVVGIGFGSYGVTRFFSPPAPQPGLNAPLVNPPPSQPVSVPATPPVSSGARAVAQVYGGAAQGPVMSSVWRVGGFVTAGTEPVDRPWPSVVGHGVDPEPPVSKTSRVVLVSDSGRTRFLSLSQCAFFSGGVDIYCDIDGERVTPWTGRGAVTAVIDAVPQVGAAASERSDLPAAPTTARPSATSL